MISTSYPPIIKMTDEMQEGQPEALGATHVSCPVDKHLRLQPLGGGFASTQRPRQNSRHFTNNISVYIFIHISLILYQLVQ